MNSYLHEKGYYLIENFIPKEQAAELAAKFKNYTEKNNIQGDDQAPNSSSFYNYWPFLELQMEKLHEVAGICEEKLLPTYTYARIYRTGDKLETHTDRDACEISLTIHLGGDELWPIQFDYSYYDETRHTSMLLNPGDAIIYLGRSMPHWRTEYKGKEYIQLFLHYVRSRGECSYTALDLFKSKDQITNDSYLDLIEQPKQNLISAKPNTSLSEYIQIFRNVIPKKLCQDIINEYKEEEFIDTLVGVNTLDPTVRSAKTIFMSHDETIEKNPETRRNLDERIFKAASTVLNKYVEIYPHCNIKRDTGYQLLRYNKGDFYIEHTDSFDEHPRSLSCSFILNDDYAGGEFSFFGGEFQPYLQCGDAIMFPSNFMFPHQIFKVKEGTRYSIITWFI